MKANEYKVLITASGVGTGLGEIIKYRNKTLIRVDTKPVIAHIIESYPKAAHFVITLGHFGSQVKDYLELAYPDRDITFVKVDKYTGEGSSLGYSMLCAEKHLQSPFIYHASDTIIKQRIPVPDTNWIGGFNGEGSSNYTSFNILNGKIQKIMDKGILNPDYLHIGLVGVHDYKNFWKTLKKLYKQNIYGEGLADFHVWNDLIEQGSDFKINEFTQWFDTGNIDSLKKHFAKTFYNLDKNTEAIFIHDNKKVLKLYQDPLLISQLVARSRVLKSLVPKVTDSNNNFLTYNFVRGDLYADVANPKNFEEFLHWSQKHVWQPVKEVSDTEFKKHCYKFYYNKTLDRIEQFLKTRNIVDTENIINDEKVPSVKEMFTQIDFDWLTTTSQTHFHGDYILDNIIKTPKGYTLLDWRANFGGLIKAGDMYYDLAKLNHNLTINHQIISNDLFTIKRDKNNVTCDILRKENLVQCQRVLFEFLAENNYNTKKVEMLTALVWFSSSSLHHHPYDLFLFYFAKLQLWRAINE